MSVKLNFGSDPEFFVVNSRNDLVYACDVAESIGTVVNKFGASTVYPDGIAYEINVPPSESEGILATSMLNALKSFSELIEGFGYRPLIVSTVKRHSVPRVTEGYFNVVTGCSPDMNIWNIRSEKSQLNSTHSHAGGHIHISMSNDIWDRVQEHYEWIIAALDMSLIPLDIALTETSARRVSYGVPGLFRMGSYGESMSGIEYRSMSAPILLRDDKLASIVIKLCRSVVSRVVDVILNMKEDAAINFFVQEMMGDYRAMREIVDQFLSPDFYNMEISSPYLNGMDREFNEMFRDALTIISEMNYGVVK